MFPASRSATHPFLTPTYCYSLIKLKVFQIFCTRGSHMLFLLPGNPSLSVPGWLLPSRCQARPSLTEESSLIPKVMSVTSSCSHSILHPSSRCFHYPVSSLGSPLASTITRVNSNICSLHSWILVPNPGSCIEITLSEYLVDDKSKISHAVRMIKVCVWKNLIP